MAVVNLNVYKDITIDFMLGDKLIKVKEPSYGLIQEFANVEEAEDRIDAIAEILVKVLNNNTSAVTFTKEEIKAWNKSLVDAVINEIATNKREIENAPN